ncbi:hypothetical protein BJX63DRAFT_344212 [Aspergillus granulosus]|uniref:Uncharacterized protein n=1 Tax=Aspergillus granulosus TaxID=176169 RepID=A0ABR4H2V1_9EURO
MDSFGALHCHAHNESYRALMPSESPRQQPKAGVHLSEVAWQHTTKKIPEFKISQKQEWRSRAERWQYHQLHWLHGLACRAWQSTKSSRQSVPRVSLYPAHGSSSSSSRLGGKRKWIGTQWGRIVAQHHCIRPSSRRAVRLTSCNRAGTGPFREGIITRSRRWPWEPPSRPEPSRRRCRDHPMIHVWQHCQTEWLELMSSYASGKKKKNSCA